MSKISSFAKHYQQYENWFTEHTSLYEAELAAVKGFIPDEGLGFEVGVGSGLFSKPLGLRFGVDPCREMLALAQKRGIKVVRGRAEALPCKSGKFDYILMVTVVCFFDDPRKAFQEVKRALVSGGKLIVAFIDRASLEGQEYERQQEKSTFYKEARFFSSEEMIQMLKRAGFERFSFKQCLIASLETLKKADVILSGYGKGGFVVIEAT